LDVIKYPQPNSSASLTALAFEQSRQNVLFAARGGPAVILDDELHAASSLPKVEAFSKLEHRANERFEAAHRVEPYGIQRSDHDIFEYAETVAALAEACEINQLIQFDLFAKSNESGYEASCWAFRKLARRISQRTRFSTVLRAGIDPNTVELDAATKQVLRFHLDQIKSTVDKLEVTDLKRRRLYNAINKLAGEIDKERTPLAAVVDMVAEACDGAEPILDVARKMAAIFRDSKDAELKKLPTPEEQKRLGPPNGAAKSNPKEDEIPF